MSDYSERWQFQPGVHLDEECKGCGKQNAILGNMRPWVREGYSEIYYCYWCKQCVEDEVSLQEFFAN